MSAYSSNATEGLRNLAQSLSTAGPASLRCPQCNADLLVHFSGRNERWSARHPRPSTCALGLACWGSATTEIELREQFAAGIEPRTSNPETVAKVMQWIQRLALVNDHRNRDR